MRLASDSKLAYYPTDEIETLRLLALIGDIHYRDYYKMNRDFWRLVVGDEEYKRIWHLTNTSSTWDNLDRYYYFDWCLKNNALDIIKENFYFSLNNNVNNSQFNTVVADLFCGEGEWLKKFSEMHTVLVGNEIEENRFKKAKKGLNYCWNLAFEDLDLPKNSIDLMLFNPPYGETGGERNVRKYFRMIIERELMSKETNPYSSYNKNGIIVMVISESDAHNIADLFVKHFDFVCNYKVNPEEYDKWNQHIIIGRFKNSPLKDLDYHNKSDAEYFINEVNSKKEFNPKLYNEIGKYGGMQLGNTDFATKLSNHEFIKHKENYLSKKDNVYQWAKDRTLIEDLGISNLVMPRPPKLSEIANILASGYINSEVETEEGKHIAIGGIKTLVKKEESRYNDGETEGTLNKFTRMSVPFLNISYVRNGKLTIKEIGEDNDTLSSN